MLWQVIFLLILLIPILAIVLDSQLGRALAARVERRGLGDGNEMTAQRLGYLEGEVERLAAEVARLEEESEFLHKLLLERTGTEPRGTLPGGEHGG